jgi:hypothetical protein
MVSLKDIFRIRLIFLDRLDLVEAVAEPTIVSGAPESATAILRGADELEEFLIAAGIDSYLVTSGDPLSFHGTVSYTLHRAEPKFIVQNLKRRFEDEDAVQLKIISGERIGDSEWSAKVPVSITVSAQSVTSSESLGRVRPWNEKA